MSEHSGTPSFGLGHRQDVHSSDEHGPNGVSGAGSHYTWSQYTTVSSPLIPSVTSPGPSVASTWAQGHGEPPEELSTEREEEEARTTDSLSPLGDALPHAEIHPHIAQMQTAMMGEPPLSSDEQEEMEHYYPPPERNLGLVGGNGPAPTTQGNIGDSISTEMAPPNGI